VTIADARLYRYRLPLTDSLRVGGHSLAERQGLLLRVTGPDGREGWGEAAPLPGFSPDTLDDATTQARRLRADLPGLNLAASSLDALLDRLPTNATPASVRFAVESAAVELLAATQNSSVRRVLGGGDGTVALNALIPATTPDLDAVADRIRRAGYRAVKVKVGRADAEADATRVRRLRGLLGPDVALRLDANRLWTWDAAVAFAEALGDVPLAYVEEPLRTPGRLPEFVEQTGLPVALDETTRERRPETLPADFPVRAVVLKPTLLGGIGETRRWAEWARARDATLVLSASYESGVGLRMLAALAGALSEAPAGLSTYSRLADDVLRPRLSLDGAEADVEQGYASDVDRSMLDELSR
jgi:O-succinylbenzoate synthase